VVATLAPSLDGGSGARIPPTNAFLLVLDREARRAILGGAGRAAVVPVTTSDGRTFKVTAPFSVGAPSGTRCAEVLAVDYKSLEVTITGDTLVGRAAGTAQISCGDCIFNQAFSAALTGTLDVKAPFIL